ncbi:sigma-70 family RNA polymerase sigma factor [Acidobacteria bacterium AH-259-O06]|nr:sigma-70 family RNA polymerase sigma factor [Acidobacteria bacterium AH-259-O06]
MGDSLGSVLSRQRVESQQDSEKGQEELWVEAAQAGDTVAFNRLVLKWEQPIYNLILRMLDDPEEAAEVTQETFLSAYKSLRRFRRQAKFSTWLYRIASNHSISRLRKRPPGTQYSLDDSASSINERPRTREHQETQVLEQERQDRVRLALDQLQPDQKIVVELKFYQERTFVEISDILGIPLSTAKSRLYAGLESLKIWLSDSTEPERIEQ